MKSDRNPDFWLVFSMLLFASVPLFFFKALRRIGAIK
jgi:hypothetical protein